MKKNKKSNKKKLIAIFLFLFALSGVIGYGAYSYYWTQGSYETEEETINIIAFDPEIYEGGEQYFLGNGGTIELNCNNSSSTGKDTIECGASATIINSGGTPILVEASNVSFNVDVPSNVDVDYSDASITFDGATSIEIAPGEDADMNIYLPLVIDNGTDNGDGGSSAVEVHAPVSGGDITVSVDLNLVATQVQD